MGRMDKTKLDEALGKLKQMEAPFEGGCLCQQVRYRCDKEPLWSSNCHCHSCQKLGSGAFTTAYTVLTKDFQLLTGEVLKFERLAKNGHKVWTVRCKNCGTWVYAEREGNPDFRGVLASTLDDSSKFTPISNVFVSEAAPWVIIDETLLNFNGMPEDELSD